MNFSILPSRWLPIQNQVVPAMVTPKMQRSRESIINDAFALDCRFCALRLREDVATNL